MNSKEVFALRKQGDFKNAFALAKKLIENQPNDEWICRAYAWCMIDLLKLEAKEQNYNLAQKYFNDLKALPITKRDNLLSDQLKKAEILCQPGWELVETAIELSKAKKYVEASTHFHAAMDKFPNSAVVTQSYAWCLIHLFKNDVDAANYENLSKYKDRLKKIEVIDADEKLTARIERLHLEAHPDWKFVFEGEKLSAQEEHERAADCFRQALKTFTDNQKLHDSLGWQLYKIIQSYLKRDAVNAYKTKRILAEYLSLKNTRPSLLHSLLLGVALKFAQNQDFNHVEFLKLWDLNYLRTEDWEQFYQDNGSISPSLAEKVAQRTAKDCLKRSDSKGALFITPLIDQSLLKYPDNIWICFYKAKLLLLTGEPDEAAKFGLRVVKGKINDFWSWGLLGKVYEKIDDDLAISCYYRSLTCVTDESFLGSVRTDLAVLLIKNQRFSEAKYEVETVLKSNESNNRQHSSTLTQITSQSWYQDTLAPADLKYSEKVVQAETILLEDMPLIKGIIGESFTANSGKLQRKIYLKIDKQYLPAEIIVPDQQCSRKSFGENILVRGEFISNDFFKLYQMIPDDTERGWQIFPEMIGVVTGINNQKELLHCIVKKGLEGIVKFKDLEKKPSVGSCLEIRAGISKSRDKNRLSILNAKITDRTASIEVMKDFDERVTVSNDFGFTDSNIFIDPGLLEKSELTNGQRAKGTAILNFNKKKGVWGWKAIKAEVGD